MIISDFKIKSHIKKMLFLFLVLPVYSVICTAGQSVNIDFNGTIIRSNINPKFYVIESNNTTYDPMNLDPRYQDVNLMVRVNATIQEDLSGFKVFGTVIKINQISAANYKKE